MKPTNYGEEIFPYNNCENPAQPPIKTESRKKVIFRNNHDDAIYYLNLTDDQIDLLEWLVGKVYIIDGNYETVQDMDFITP